MDRQADVVVVGGGVVGLAFAWEAARRGRSVVVFERSPRAEGASVRNFGMVWPVGQPAGRLHARALRSAERWLELRDRAGVWVHPCGSLHVAHAADEAAVLREFADCQPPGSGREYLDPAEAVGRFPAVNPDGLTGALYSPTELCVDPPAAVPRLAAFLAEAHGVTVRFGAGVVGVDGRRVRLGSGEEWRAGEQVVVASGADFATLFPAVYAAAGVRLCKLQMMKTVPQPVGWRLGPHVAGGLTLAHYRGFEGCPSLPALKARLAADYPEHARYGVHVMASQNAAGEVVIGDSHEYDAAVSPFDKPKIDALILDYLRRLVRLPDWTVAARWHGLYAKHPIEPVVLADPQPGVTVAAALGGAGMTLAFGTAADWWDEHG
jgi:FAD dependent oxidoreductase TIGR03364